MFFFAAGENYSPIGFVRVPGPVQALEWSPHTHVSFRIYGGTQHISATDGRATGSTAFFL